MKFYKLLIFMLAFTLFASVNVMAQDDDCCDDDGMVGEEMTMEEWQRQMDELNAQKTDLLSQLAALNADINALRNLSSDLDGQLTKAQNDLYGAVGTDKAGVDAFRSQFEACEKKVNTDCKNAQDCFNAISASKIKCLNEFWDRYQAMKKKMDACDQGKPCAQQYTVVKGDCLYKIAGRSTIYGNSRYWPKIWEANKNGVISAPNGVAKTIPNPNRIYPGQVLCIPALSDADKKMMENKKQGVKKTRKQRGKEPVTNMKDAK
jgi:hypothetical protein